MSKVELDPGRIPDVLAANLGKENVRFVFASDVALNSWAEWCIKNPEKSGTCAVAMEKFVAWDKFKEKSVIAREEGKHAIPALLRKIFVYNLIAENAEKAKTGKENAIFKSIINPVYAGEAYSFADWISGNLPSLKMWHEKFSQWMEKNPGASADDEDRDYLELYNRYSSFLGDTMFEPSWIVPDFEEGDEEFLIFYPEQLEDFAEYESILFNASNVKVYMLPEEHEKQKVYEYSNARLELRRTALKIRDLMENGCSSEDIAVHVPQLETYAPYIKREFENYCIPFVIRKGEPYTLNSAGSVFREIQECYNSGYSYDSIRTLLLNSCIPWKDMKLNESLVREGNRLHCLCSYEKGETNDVWIKALSPLPYDKKELNHYKKLRKAAGGMCNASSFKAISDSWFKFKEQFLSEEDFTKSADNILSRCILLLQELVQIEKDFIEPLNLKVENPFSFYLSELNSKTYRPQEEISGVSVFDYKLAACSSYKYNFVINCTQNAINVSYRPVSFLNSIKRQKLDFADNDAASEAFVRLYGKFNNEENVSTWFSCSIETFSGFAIPHNCFEKAGENPFEELDEKDFYLNEKKWIMEKGNVPDKLFLRQKNQFDLWKETSDFYKGNTDGKKLPEENSALQEKIKTVLYEKRSEAFENEESMTGLERENALVKKDASIMKVTQKDFSQFFPCPRKWLLQSVLKLKEDSLDLNLLGTYDQGNILHKMLELFALSAGKLPVCRENTFGEEEDKKIKSSLEDFFVEAVNDEEFEFSSKPLVMEALLSQKNLFTDIIFRFLKNFCSEKNFGGYRVYKTEGWFCGKDKDLPFAYLGKMDCILSSDEDDGSYYILDYKTGTLPAAGALKVDENNRLGDFQCVFYVKLWKLNEKAASSLKQMTFSKITGTMDLRKSFDVDEKTKDDYFSSEMNCLEDYGSQFYESVKECSFEPVSDFSSRFSNLAVYTDCKACDFKGVCRTLYTVAGHSLKY